jgi:hypothetical protein
LSKEKRENISTDRTKKHKKPFSKVFKVGRGWEANPGPFVHFLHFSALYRLAITALLLKNAL